MILNGMEKSALVLMSIGTDQAAEILKHLTPFEVQELITSMINIKQFSAKTLNSVLYEFYNIAIKNNTVNCDNSDAYLHEMLTKALGEKQGQVLLKKELEIRNAKTYIEALNCIKPKKLASVLNKEHPQIVTIILICLEKNHVGEILSFFSNEKRAEIILRIAEFNGIEETNLIELTKVIHDLFKNKKLILSNKGGLKNAIKILNTMDVQNEIDTVNNIKIINKKIANEIKNKMFVFENLLNVDDEYIDFIIKNVEKEKLYIALQNTSLVIRQKFLKNMSEKDSQEFRTTLEKQSYISHEAIANEQKLILIMLKQVLDKKNISLSKLSEYYA